MLSGGDPGNYEAASGVATTEAPPLRQAALSKRWEDALRHQQLCRFPGRSCSHGLVLTGLEKLFQPTLSSFPPVKAHELKSVLNGPQLPAKLHTRIISGQSWEDALQFTDTTRSFQLVLSENPGVHYDIQGRKRF